MRDLWLIRDPVELQRLLTTPSREFRVELPALFPEENLALERLLRRHYNACGCAEGTVGLLVGMVVSALFWVFVSPYGWLGNAWASIGFSIALSGIGKVVGKVRARRSLRSVLRSLR
jgi:hypothetical protein